MSALSPQFKAYPPARTLLGKLTPGNDGVVLRLDAWLCRFAKHFICRHVATVNSRSSHDALGQLLMRHWIADEGLEIAVEDTLAGPVDLLGKSA